MPTLFEFKARTTDIGRLERQLLVLEPRFVGEDHQVDTYFHVPDGRLKLREGTIEHALIFYKRPDLASAKKSEVLLYPHQPDAGLKRLLTAVLGVKAVVNKRRKIYFIQNVKFHFDRVEGLGMFVEVEAIDANGDIGIERLQEQCAYYRAMFGISDADFVAASYSDLLMAKKSSTA